MQKNGGLRNYFFILLFLPFFFCGASAKAMAQSKGECHIAIFKEEGFPSAGLPDGLTPEWLGTHLSTRGFSVAYLNALQLAEKPFLDPSLIDILVLPYGETFPAEAFDSIKNYLEKGGGLFTLAGRPFWLPLKKINGRWRKIENKPYEEYMAQLGIKYYQTSLQPHSCEFNRDLFQGLTGRYPFRAAGIGLAVSTGNKNEKTFSSSGNVFPLNFPCRDFVPVAQGLDIKGRAVTSAAILVKSWRNPYNSRYKVPNPWCLIGISGNAHPLNPKWPQAEEFFNGVMAYLSNKIRIHSVGTNYACYRQNEQVAYEAKVLNDGENDTEPEVRFNFKDSDNTLVYSISRKIDLPAHREVAVTGIWLPEKFSSDFYTLEAVVSDKGACIDSESNGFVVWNDTVLKQGSPLRTRGLEFFSGDKKIFIAGVNYYESKQGEFMWLHPNMRRIHDDFRKMRELGINFMRVHYHHSKWFRDYVTEIATLPLDPYFDVSDTGALPAERSLRILDASIQLAQKYGLIFCMDIFSLVPEEMGDPEGWLGKMERVRDPERVRVQKEFIRMIAQRYKAIPGITWDLWNEPRVEEEPDIEALRSWAGRLIEVFRENGDNHLVTIGDDVSLQLIDVLDYVSLHTGDPGKFNPPPKLDKPFIFQEVWNDAGASAEEESRQAKKLNKDFRSALRAKAQGFVPWQWTRQARLWDSSNEAERWDDELGACVREDGTLKPSGREYADLLGKINR